MERIANLYEFEELNKEDIYDEEERLKMLENDEINAIEEGFMLGYMAC
tara:strand:+ start:319 stop:462 length:144 start_codon:yes stop_codon:yes gene_type:complete